MADDTPPPTSDSSNVFTRLLAPSENHIVLVTIVVSGVTWLYPYVVHITKLVNQPILAAVPSTRFQSDSGAE
eukprot:6053498-Amphidinium_carterae.1